MSEPIETAEEYRARIVRNGLELTVAFAALVAITLLGVFLLAIIRDDVADGRWRALIAWTIAWFASCITFLRWIVGRPETRLQEAARLKVKIYATRQAILEMEREHERILNGGER